MMVGGKIRAMALAEETGVALKMRLVRGEIRVRGLLLELLQGSSRVRVV